MEPLILFVFCQKKVAMIKAIPMPSVRVPGIIMQIPPTRKANLCGKFNRFWQKPIMDMDTPHIPIIAVRAL